MKKYSTNRKVLIAILVLADVVLLANIFGVYRFETVSAPAYSGSTVFNYVMDTSMGGRCSQYGEGQVGIIITGTPENLQLNTQRSYIQMSGGDTKRYGGDRIAWGYAPSYDSFFTSYLGGSQSREHLKASVVKTSSDFRIPQDAGCTFTFHLEFDSALSPTTTTTTLPGQIPTTTIYNNQPSQNVFALPLMILVTMALLAVVFI